MRKVFLLIFIITLTGITGCKKDNNNQNTEEQDQALYKSYTKLDETNTRFLDFAEASNGDPKQAIMQTAAWLNQQGDIASTEVFDSTYILATLKNGMKFQYTFITLNPDGTSKFRGSGAGGAVLKAVGGSKNCSHVIQNKKVLIYGAAFPINPNTLYTLTGTSDLQISAKFNEECKADMVEDFGKYGLVILETHGSPTGFRSGIRLNIPLSVKNYKEFRDEAISEVGQNSYDHLLNGDLLIGSNADYDPQDKDWWQNVGYSYYLWVTSQYISKIPSLSGTIILGNMCHSGTEKIEGGKEIPIATAFLSRNPASYYGYALNDKSSFEVLGDFCEAMEDTLIRSLVLDKDSTGIAYLKQDNTEFYDPTILEARKLYLYFKHFGSPSWCYGKCGEDLVDARDGQTYPTVCIGKQTWMAANLNWAGAGVCYDNNSANCATYGRLYTLDEATGRAASTDSTVVQGICPDGWHIPSAAEWQELFDYCGGNSEAAYKLRSTSLWPASNQNTDEFGFNLLPSGHYASDGVNSGFANLGNGAKLWTSSANQGSGTYMAINAYSPDLLIGGYSPPPQYIWKFSCRCVKDK